MPKREPLSASPSSGIQKREQLNVFPPSRMSKKGENHWNKLKFWKPQELEGIKVRGNSVKGISSKGKSVKVIKRTTTDQVSSDNI